ncbi:hypothetical protein [Bacteroides sp.]|uniref:hypothetical protein n=1 Tax=Bacteroides sp. TaxID=29523 RepID=UPI002628F0BB|nr:hypothetical protein [Bacteroides sp.]MDD3037925.1 hypothetical protein [Bacteroides sp.]
MKKYTKDNFTDDVKKARLMAGKFHLQYLGCDCNCFRVSFEDSDLGFRMDLYLSKMTLCIHSSNKANPIKYFKNQTWWQVESVMKTYYNYI